MSDNLPPPPPPPAYGSTPGERWAGPELASWGERVGAYLIDYVAPFVAIYIVGFVLAAVSEGLGGAFMFLGNLVAFGFVIWNLIQQGNTGQTIGKRQLGIRLLREADGAPVGAGLSVGRYFLHIVDALPCYVGFLWPLWDQKRQTFADKILSTIVVKG